MGSQRIDVRVHSDATAEAVHALLVDGATWPDWSPIGAFALEKPVPLHPEKETAHPDMTDTDTTDTAGGDLEAVGAIRIFRTGRIRSREVIVERVPGRRLSYALLSGLAIKNYRADVDLSPEGNGTGIRWHSTFDPKLPGTGWIYRRTLGRFIRQCAEGLAAAGAATAPAPATHEVTG